MYLSSCRDGWQRVAHDVEITDKAGRRVRRRGRDIIRRRGGGGE